MIGPGKYDDLCTYVRELTDADGVILVVVSGKRGQGFSMQATLEVIKIAPQVLRIIADKLDADIEKGNLCELP